MVKTGWILTALLALFMLGASVAPKLLNMQPAIDSLTSIGWPTQYLLMIGLIELAAVVLFVVPRTALIGAVLFTAVLGGAIASHLRAGSPLFSHTLFGVYLGVATWVALLLRDPALRAYLLQSRAP